MIAMLRLQFIIFSLIGIGFVTRKKGIVSREGQRSITDLVINVVLPCNIVTSFVQELPDSALRDCVMIFLISVGMEIMCMLYARIAYGNVEANRQMFRSCRSGSLTCCRLWAAATRVFP